MRYWSRGHRRTGPATSAKLWSCRGFDLEGAVNDFRSSWAGSGGYDYAAEALFSELDVDGFAKLRLIVETAHDIWGD